MAGIVKYWPAHELVTVNKILLKEEFVMVQLSDGFSV